MDPTRVDWNRVNPKAYTFSQKAGPQNNLGKVKFSFPNRHDVYLHDTLPVRKKYFKESVRMIGHECVRMEKPVQFADVLLAEANGWPDSRVKELWDNGNNSSVPLEKKIPVHMVYFTAVVNDDGKVETFADVLWARPQARHGAVQRYHGISAAAARAAQAPGRGG